MLFLNQGKREIHFPRNTVPHARIDLEAAAYEADRLPIELPRSVFSLMQQVLPLAENAWFAQSSLISSQFIISRFMTDDGLSFE